MVEVYTPEGNATGLINRARNLVKQVGIQCRDTLLETAICISLNNALSGIGGIRQLARRQFMRDKPLKACFHESALIMKGGPEDL